MQKGIIPAAKFAVAVTTIAADFAIPSEPFVIAPVESGGRYMRALASLLVVVGAIAFPSSRAWSGSEVMIAAVARPQRILWEEPVDIRTRNLYYGPGGREGQPKAPFTFVEEDHGGTNPKFEVRDAAGKRWKVKLGIEARPETAATRLLWAVGFITNDNYLLPEINVKNMPAHLSRGKTLVDSNGSIRAARLQRPPHGKKIGHWGWKHNPFVETREFNGLRVMMALLSNWDLKEVNNSIYTDDHDSGPALYEVSDLGSTFGKSGESYRGATSKNNLSAYQRSAFVSKVTRDRVSFHFPTHLPYLYIFNLPLFVSESRAHWIGQDIPRADVRWISSFLTQLSTQQIRDAFRAAGYSQEQVEGYTAVVQARIAQLEQL